MERLPFTSPLGRLGGKKGLFFIFFTMPILPSTIAVDQMGFTQIFKSVGDYGEQEEAERS